MNKYDWAQNTQKLRRIIDKIPNSTEEQIKAEYIKNGGLLNKVETITGTEYTSPMIDFKPREKVTSKVVVKAVKEKVVKAVKKVTKK